MNTKRLLPLAVVLVVAACGGSAPTAEIIYVTPEPAAAAPAATPDPTAMPTAVPTEVPTAVPTAVPTPTPEPTAKPTPAPTPAPRVIKGNGSKKTKAFALDGDYRVVAKGRATDLWGGNVIIDLVPVGGDWIDSELLVNEIVDDRGDRYSYETYVYGAFGKYYLDLTMPGGAWTVTFYPEG